MKRKLCVGILAAISLALAACGGGSSNSAGEVSLDPTPIPDSPKPTGELSELRWNLPLGEPQTFDPARVLAFSDQEAMSNMCEPLEQLMPDGSREPGLATSIEAPDPKTYVIDVREGVKFWDGSEMTAEDVAYSLNRILDPANASFYSGLAANVDTIEQTGPYEVTVSMKRPDVLYRESLVTPLGVITEKKYTEEQGDNYGTPQGGVMCTGPYKFVEWKPGSEVTLERNPDWWDADSREQLVDQVTFTFVTNPQTLASALSSGEIDGSFDIPPAAYTRLQSASDGELLPGPSTGVFALAALHTDGTIGNTKIRQAVSKLIDYDGYVEAQFNGLADPSRALMGPNSWAGAEDAYRAAYEQLPEPEQDLDAAKKLVEESGIENPVVRIATWSAVPEEAALAEQIQSAGEQIGLEVTFDDMPIAQFATLFTSESERAKYDLMIQNTAADIPEAFEFYQSVAQPTGVNNLSGWSDPEVTKILNQASAEPDADKRAKLTVEAQDTLVEELPWIPAVFPDFVAYLSSDVTGLQVSFPSVMYRSWVPDLGAP